MNWIWVQFIRIHELKNILMKREIYKNVKLTNTQKKQIDDFYKKNYGKKVPYVWHRLYTSYTGKFDYKYVPEYIFTTKLELIANQRIDVLPFENKCLIRTFFEGVSNFIDIPKVYISKIKGKYFDSDSNPISESKAIDILDKKYNNFIIKTSIDSNSGLGVEIVHLKNGKDITTDKELKDIFKCHGDDFVVTELIKQSKSVSSIYPNSVNTLRVITYVTDTGYYVAPIVMRIGRGGNNVDNAHAGGMFIAVNDDGELAKEAFTEYNAKFKKHPDSGIIFENNRLLNIDILRKEVIKLHKRIPNVMFVSWDIALNDNNHFSLIEANLHSHSTWFTQMAHGRGLFEEETGKLLSECKKGRKRK